HLVDTVCELSKQGIKLYGGNYGFYTAQKEIEDRALSQELHSKEKVLRKAKEKERETLERLQKADSRGKGKQEKAGVARIMLTTLDNNAENSTAATKSVHAEKVSRIPQERQELRSALPDRDKMRFGFAASALHGGKILFEAQAIQVTYDPGPLWKSPL